MQDYLEDLQFLVVLPQGVDVGIAKALWLISQFPGKGECGLFRRGECRPFAVERRDQILF
jgi:hypothetical protein